MGCALSKSHHRIIDSSSFKQNASSSIEIVNNAQSLINYFSDNDNPNPKCIFIFGGSGSNKGEFIYELISDQFKNEQQRKEAAYEYVYIDVERLILLNIRERVDRLTEGTFENGGHDSDHEITKSIMKKDHVKDNEDEHSEEECMRTSSMKHYLNEYGTVVTNNWLFGLIGSEIEKQWHMEPEVIFLVTLIPNRNNLFRNCLYLKQTPNLSHLNANYIAVNLIRSDRRKKDLDLVSSVPQNDENVQNFLNYFRSVNKLVEIKVENSSSKQTIKLNHSKQAIKIKNSEDLADFLKSEKKENVELDISQFDPSLSPCESLLFLVNNQIDIGDEIICVDDNEVPSNLIRKFVRCYQKLKLLNSK